MNTFDYPEKLFNRMNACPGWEFMIVRLKPEYDERTEKLPVAVGFNYKNSAGHYCAVLLGLEYNKVEKFQVYRQAIYLMLKHARSIEAKQVYLGFSASIEKRKFGATVIPKVAYIQTKDNFNMEVIGTMNVENKK